MLGVTREAWNRQLLGCSRPRLVGQWTDPVAIMRAMAHAIDPLIPEEVIRRTTEKRIEKFAASLIHIPAGTVSVLTALRNAGKKLALVSNADVMEIQAWDRSPIAGLFDAVLFSCHVGLAKPEPEIYSLCLARLDAAAEECVFVGDGGSNELEGARECGIAAIMMTGIIKEMYPERIEEGKRQADFVIDDLAELVTVGE